MKRIDHLIDGKAVPGRDYFETINPANQDVLAEVAAGGTEEINAAVAAAKAAFPKWAATPAAERAKLMVKLGDLILTGTPEGVSNVNPGDEVVCEIDGIGRLVNTLV